MWDEDPRVGESSYRLLKWSVVAGLVGGFIIALLTADWSFYGIFLASLGVWITALAIYAALVWVIGNSVRWTRLLIARRKCRLNKP